MLIENVDTPRSKYALQQVFKQKYVEVRHMWTKAFT